MVYIEVINEAKGVVEEILTQRKQTANPPPRTKKQIIQETGLGFFGGLFVGFICRKVGKMAFTTIGGGITCISLLGQLGYVKVDWKKVNQDYNILKQRHPDIDISKYPIKEIIKENLPLASGVAGGTFIAIAT